MRHRIPVVVSLVLSGLGAAPLGAQTSASASPSASPLASPLARMHWLEGCWLGRAGASVVEEQWLPLRAGTLVGASRSSRGERTTDVELAIVRLAGDTLIFEAHPMSQATARFAAEMQTDSSVTFANPRHDFPQRIVYRRVGRDSLHARIEGPGQGGAVRGLDFRYARTACGGGDLGRAP